MKNRERSTPLSATEFAATLNSDNPHSVLLALRRFVKTVQRERQIALNVDQSQTEFDELSSQDLEDDVLEDEVESPTKKYKKSEEWKQDTQSYDVPFVGTAVAAGKVAEAIPGQWPTGLLLAYLDRSPVAAELTGTDLIPPEGAVVCF